MRNKMRKCKISIVLQAMLTAAFALLAFSITHSSEASAYTPSSCAISPSFSQPLMPDADCDGIIDSLDNCVFVPNHFQRDSDNNGLGDSCDLYIESIGTSPSDFVYTGRAFKATATVVNNRPHNVRNARVGIIMPQLGIEAVKHVENLGAFESRTLEFTLRAPVCSNATSYDLVAEAVFSNYQGAEERTLAVTRIRIVPDTGCNEQLSGKSLSGNSYIDVLEIQDVHKGSEASFPIKITNKERSGKEYIISVAGLGDWGMFRIMPNSLVIVPSGSERIIDLYISARRDAALGERAFIVTVQSGEEAERFLLIANIKERQEIDSQAFAAFGFRIALLTILLLIAVIAVGVAVAKFVSGERRKARLGQ
jgi:hypothetical protein